MNACTGRAASTFCWHLHWRYHFVVYAVGWERLERPIHVKCVKSFTFQRDVLSLLYCCSYHCHSYLCTEILVGNGANSNGQNKRVNRIPRKRSNKTERNKKTQLQINTKKHCDAQMLDYIVLILFLRLRNDNNKNFKEYSHETSHRILCIRPSVREPIHCAHSFRLSDKNI